MQWWAIIKVIAGIIANLPFSEGASDEEIESAVQRAVGDCAEGDVSVRSFSWQELIPHIVAIIKLLQKKPE